MSAPTRRLQSIEINLLQIREEEASGSRSVFPALLLAVLAAAALGMGWMWLDAKAAIAKTNAALEKANAEIKQNEARLASSPTAGGAADFLSLPQKLSASKPNPVDVLDKLTKLMPAASNLTTLTFGDGNALKVTGNFASTEEVISFMQAVKSSAAFSLISTGGMTKIPIAQPAPDDKQAPAAEDAPLPVIQVTFDLKYNADSNKKG
jgi:Tfp pilus assembly protein PilN